MKWALGLLLGAVALVILGGVGWLMHVAHEPDVYRDEISRVLSEATGRKVSVEGDVELGLSLAPRFVMNGVTIAGEEGGDAPPTARIERFEAELGLDALLRRQIDVRRVFLSGVGLRVVMEPADEGLQPVAPIDRIPRWLDRLALRRMIVRDAIVMLVDPAEGRVVTVELDHLGIAAGGGEQALAITAAADVAGEAIDMRGIVGSIAVLASAGRLPLDLEIGWRGHDIAVTTELLLEQDRVTLQDIEGSWDDIVFGGHLDLVQGDDRPVVEGRLEVREVDLSHWPPAEEPSEREPWDVPDLPLNLDLARMIDADLDLGVRLLRTRLVDLAAFRARVVVEQGAVIVDPMTGALFGGSVSGALVLEPLTTEVVGHAIAVGVDLETRRLDVGELAALGTGEPMFDMPSTVTVALSGRGRTLPELLGSLGGTIDLEADGGRIRAGMVDALSGDLLVMMRQLVAPGRSMPVICAVGRATITKGVVALDPVFVATPDVSLGATGSVDPLRQHLDVLVVPRPRDTGLFNLSTPIVIEGAFAKPRVASDSTAVARHVGTVVAGLAFGPAALLAPLVGERDDAPDCAEAVASARETFGFAPRPGMLEREAEAVE